MCLSDQLRHSGPDRRQVSSDLLIGIPDQFWCLGCCNCGKFICFPSCGTHELPKGTPCHQILFRRMPICANSFFPPNHGLSWPPRHPSPSIIFGKMPICGKCFPSLLPLPDTYPGHLQPLPYVSPVCMHLFIANTFYL